jgi:putative transcriptional regulator
MNVFDVRKLRRKLSLNQVEFAQLAGVHPITVSKWERKEAFPTPYQAALFEQYEKGAEDKEVRTSIKYVLITAGVIIAIALLLRHLMKGK